MSIAFEQTVDLKTDSASCPTAPFGFGRLESIKLALPFLLLTLTLFGQVLFSSEPLAIGHPGNDLTSQFRYWQQFGWEALRHGHLPLWNPHAFCGLPFFGNWQTALLYPPNWLGLFLPWWRAINWIFAFHFFLAGWLTALWARFGGISRTGSVLAGVVTAGGGGFFLHFYAGHQPFIAVAPWAPLILLCIDGMLIAPRRRWILLGIAGVAMQIFAGFPQMVYYTALVAGVYLLIQLPRAQRPLAAIGGVGLIYLGGAAIAAIQIAAGIDADAESVRAAGASIQLASSFSLPPENIATLIAPHLYGDMAALAYFGRWFLWESCLFVGVAPLALALCGMAAPKHRLRLPVIVLLLVTGLLALGSYTTLFPVLYKYLPLFGSFRVASRFGFFIVMFIAVLAGVGVDRLRQNSAARGFWLILFIPAVAAILFTAVLAMVPRFNIQLCLALIDHLRQTGEAILPDSIYADSRFQTTAPRYILQQFAIAASSLLLISILFYLTGRRRWPVMAIVAFGLLEIVSFDLHQSQTQPTDLAMPTAWQSAIAAQPAADRVYVDDLVFTNGQCVPASAGRSDIFGYDPLAPRRLTEFLAFTQNRNPASADYSMSVRNFDPLLKMLRLGLVVRDEEHPQSIPVADPMPRASIIHDWRLTPTREDCFVAMKSPDFDSRKTVLLESAPDPVPAAESGNDDVTISNQSDDEVEISANLQTPGILLITDNYSAGWRIIPLDDSQPPTKVLPADWTLRAVPLSAGRHHFLMRFLPRGFRVGECISLAALCTYAMFMAVSCRSTRRGFID